MQHEHEHRVANCARLGSARNGTTLYSHATPCHATPRYATPRYAKRRFVGPVSRRLGPLGLSFSLLSPSLLVLSTLMPTLTLMLPLLLPPIVPAPLHLYRACREYTSGLALARLLVAAPPSCHRFRRTHHSRSHRPVAPFQTIEAIATANKPRRNARA